MTPLDSLCWKSDRNFGRRHLAPFDSPETLCGLIAPPMDRTWSITREPIGAFFTDPTGCLNCAAEWLRNRGRELHQEKSAMSAHGSSEHRHRTSGAPPISPPCRCANPRNVHRESDGSVFCGECFSVVEL
jgi:hypothetical protein